MTYNEFLDALRNTPRNWYLSHGTIRWRAGFGMKCCPITAVGRVCGLVWSDVALRLGLDLDLAMDIANAADYLTHQLADSELFKGGHDMVGIRADLLAACGLPQDQFQPAYTKVFA